MCIFELAKTDVGTKDYIKDGQTLQSSKVRDKISHRKEPFSVCRKSFDVYMVSLVIISIFLAVGLEKASCLCSVSAACITISALRNHQPATHPHMCTAHKQEERTSAHSRTDMQMFTLIKT